MIVWAVLIGYVSCAVEYALKQDGTLQSWGGFINDNMNGQLGLLLIFFTLVLGMGMSAAANGFVVQSYIPLLADFPYRVRSVCTCRQSNPPKRNFITDDGQLFWYYLLIL
jgi:hypothetical protein